MYLRSAPLQNTPLVPRRITARTSSSRAQRSAARRKSCAVVTSSELNRAERAIVMIATAPARSTVMKLISADPRQQLAVGFGEHAAPEPRIDHDRPGELGRALG